MALNSILLKTKVVFCYANIEIFNPHKKVDFTKPFLSYEHSQPKLRGL